MGTNMVAATNRNQSDAVAPPKTRPLLMTVTRDPSGRRQFPRQEVSSVTVRASADAVFAFLDTHDNIAAHMNRPSWAMLGGTMTTSLDNAVGKEIGSVINVQGQVLGVPISLAEIVVEREPPRCKRWETVGTPRLIVIGSYRMGFEIEPAATGCRVTASIDYEFPRTLPGKLVGRLVGPSYARWCVNRIVEAVAKHFVGTEAALAT